MSFDDFTATTYKSLGYLRAVDTLIYNIQYHFLVYEVADILGILQYKCHVLYPSFDLPTTYCFHRTYFEPLSKYKVIGKEKYFSLIFRNREFHNCKKPPKKLKSKNMWKCLNCLDRTCFGIFSGSISHLFVDTQTWSISSILMSYIHFIHHFQSFILHQCFCLITSLCNGLLSSCQKDFQQISVFSWHSIFWKKTKVAQNFDNAKRSTIVVSNHDCAVAFALLFGCNNHNLLTVFA